MNWRTAHNRRAGNVRPCFVLYFGEFGKIRGYPINAHHRARLAWRERIGDEIPELELVPSRKAGK